MYDMWHAVLPGPCALLSSSVSAEPSIPKLRAVTSMERAFFHTGCRDSQKRTQAVYTGWRQSVSDTD